MALYSGALSLGAAVGAALSPGMDLWPTIVADESGRTLGLAWSNRDSLGRAVQERAGVYWSRSRGSLWVKGESSGHRQRLLSVHLDCDRDALLFVVRQEGAGFCHQGTRSCFGDRFDVTALERAIFGRMASEDCESATRKLTRDPQLLSAKLREEAGELAEAETREEVLHEAADVIYLVLTAAARAGLHMADIESELGRRSLRISRRPMEAKS
jgi:phosphoribosyl-AMP cyclohydrolase / phosphoribosyl-ATP pyrophosphohydrolase